MSSAEQHNEVTGVPVILFRCDASRRLGMGHLVRCCAVARAAAAGGRVHPVFALRADEQAVHYVQRQGFSVSVIGAESEEDAALHAAVSATGASVAVLDVRSSLTRGAVADVRRSGVAVVSIDDGHERRLEADLAIYPPVPQVSELSWAGFKGTCLIGWEWVVLRPGFAPKPQSRSHSKVGANVLVTMGGGDPFALTCRVVDDLAAAAPWPASFTIVLGPAYGDRDRLHGSLANAPLQWSLRENVDDMAALMRTADVAVATFGMTAYELAACGVPALYLCLDDDQVRSATALAGIGAGVSLGRHDRLPVGCVATALRNVLDDIRRRPPPAGDCPLDGRGAERIATQLVQLACRGRRT